MKTCAWFVVWFAGCSLPEAAETLPDMPVDFDTILPAEVVAAGPMSEPTLVVPAVGRSPVDLFRDTQAPTVSAIPAGEVLYVGHHLEIAVSVDDNVGVTRCELWLNDTSWSMVQSGDQATRMHFLTDSGHFAARVACADAADNLGVGPTVTLIVSEPVHPCRLFAERDESTLPTGLLYPAAGEELFLGAIWVHTQCATEFRYVTLYDWERELETYGAHVVVRDISGNALTTEVAEPFATSHAAVMPFLRDDVPLFGDVPFWMGIYVQLHLLPGHARVAVRPLHVAAAVEAEDEAVLVAGVELPSEIIVYPPAE